ncbi:MAG: hypothetical protein Q4C64_05660, partial [Erysipelotrichia bacterium]|nr:hypothetical protein [Erysipelotrichia bacterium]
MSEKKRIKFDEIKEKGEAVGEWLKDSGKFVAEKTKDAAIWAGEAKNKAAIIADETAKVTKKILDNIKQAKQESDYKILRPIFAEDLKIALHNIPKMVNICEMDEKRKNNPVCLNSIGYQSSPNGLDVLNIFENYFSQFDLTLLPGVNEGVYYVNPYISNTYISIDKYFKYIKEEKVRELVRIAKDLGANRVIVEISEKETNSEHNDNKIKMKAGKGKADVDFDKTQKENVEVTVAANEKWSGHNNPKKPELVYFKDENHIKDLIEMRFDPLNRLQSHTYEIEYTSSSSIKIKEAAKIDGALKVMKFNMSQSMSS